MKTVKIRKAELKAIVTKNAAKHRDDLADAWDGYNKACIDVLEKLLAKFRSGEKVTAVQLYERPPEDHTKDYDRVLKMIDMSVDNEIELDQNDFSRYVLDEWEWKEMWAVSNSKYLSSRA
jgi:hypothetical protein